MPWNTNFGLLFEPGVTDLMLLSQQVENMTSMDLKDALKSIKHLEKEVNDHVSVLKLPSNQDFLRELCGKNIEEQREINEKKLELPFVLPILLYLQSDPGMALMKLCGRNPSKQSIQVFANGKYFYPSSQGANTQGKFQVASLDPRTYVAFQNKFPTRPGLRLSGKMTALIGSVPSRSRSRSHSSDTEWNDYGGGYSNADHQAATALLALYGNTYRGPGGLSKITKKNSYKKPKKRGSKKKKGKGGKKGKGTKKGKVHGILNRIRAVRTKYSKKKTIIYMK